MEDLIKIIKQFEENGYTPKMMEDIIKNYMEEEFDCIEICSVDEIVCALQEEQSCWED